jgi:hypothetical protein
MTIDLSPVEKVLAQLGKQKWAFDTRDAQELPSLYTADSSQVIYRGGPAGQTEIARTQGRDEIIGGIVRTWAATAETWYPGSLLHLIGSHVIEPEGEGRLRCRSYASFLRLSSDGVAEMSGYGTYDDIWALEEDEWRLAARKTVMYGHTPSGHSR